MNVNLLIKLSVILLSISFILACSSGENIKNDQPFDSGSSDMKKSGTQKTDSNDSISTLMHDSTQHFVFLTLDDGPQPPGTSNCLKVFKEKGIKASFFCVGFNRWNLSREKTVDSIRNGFPQFIAVNHGFSHAMFNHYRHFYLPTSIDSALKDFLYNEQFLKISDKVIRFPGLNTWALNGRISGHSIGKLLAHRLDSLGYQVIGWDIEWRGNRRNNAPKESATEMARRVMEQLSTKKTRTPGAIVILTHDRYFAQEAAVDSLKTFIDRILSNPNIHFETIDRYASLNRIRSLKETINSGN